MATLYFYNAAANQPWSTLGNWWTNAIHTIAAGALPVATDDVVIDSSVSQVGYPATVVNATNAGYDFTLQLTVTGVATFNSTAKNKGVINGTCIFNATSENFAGAVVVGACTFNTSALNDGTVTGACTFNNNSIIDTNGIVNGACSFSSMASCYGVVNGTCTWAGSGLLAATAVINGDCTFSSAGGSDAGSIIYGKVTVSGSTILAGTVYSNVECTFAGTSRNQGAIYGPAAFSGTSWNNTSGEVRGDVAFSGSSIDKGLVTGTCVFSGTATATGTSVFYGDVTVGTGCVLTNPTIEGNVTTTGTATINGGTVLGNVTASGSSILNTAIIGDCVFSGSSHSVLTVDGTGIFNGTSQNTGVHTGTATFNDTSVNLGFVVGTANFLDNSTNNVAGEVIGVANVYWPSPYPIGGTVTGDTNYYGYNFIKATAAMAFTGLSGSAMRSTLLPTGPMACNMGFAGAAKLKVPQSVPVALLKMGFSGSITLTPSDVGYTVTQALAAIFSVWGSKCNDCADYTKGTKGAAALDILNGCLQAIFLNSKEFHYLNRETLTLSTSVVEGGKTYYALPDSAQAVVGPVLMNSTQGVTPIVRHLVGCLTRAKYLNFDRYYTTPGKPKVYGYHVDRSRSGTGDNARIRIYLTSVPAGETSITLTADVERETPRYRALDCSSGTPIPMPHQYAESLLVPLLKEAAAMSIHCVRRDNQAPITEAAKAARAKYGMADPQNPNLEPKPERATKP